MCRLLLAPGIRSRLKLLFDAVTVWRNMSLFTKVTTSPTLSGGTGVYFIWSMTTVCVAAAAGEGKPADSSAPTTAAHRGHRRGRKLISASPPAFRRGTDAP